MRRNKENLNKISELCDYLSDRDVRLKDEHAMFKKIIEDLPIKVFALKVSKDMKVVCQLGQTPMALKDKNLLEIFEKDSDYILSCIKTMNGENTKSQINLGGNTFECKNNPIIAEDGDVNSFISVVWSK